VNGPLQITIFLKQQLRSCEEGVVSADDDEAVVGGGEVGADGEAFGEVFVVDGEGLFVVLNAEEGV